MVKPGDTVVAIHGQREECPGRGQRISGFRVWEPPPTHPVPNILVILTAVAFRYRSAAVCLSIDIMVKKDIANSRRTGMMSGRG